MTGRSSKIADRVAEARDAPLQKAHARALSDSEIRRASKRLAGTVKKGDAESPRRRQALPARVHFARLHATPLDDQCSARQDRRVQDPVGNLAGAALVHCSHMVQAPRSKPQRAKAGQSPHLARARYPFCRMKPAGGRTGNQCAGASPRRRWTLRPVDEGAQPQEIALRALLSQQCKQSVIAGPTPGCFYFFLFGDI
jgi:hypothetical protein